MEKTRKASDTESVPSAESLRPVKGKVSGPRWHWQLILTRQTWLTSGSINRAIRSGSLPKMLDLLAVVGIDHVGDGLVYVVEGQHGNYRPELLFMIDSHFGVGRIKDGRKKEAAAMCSSGRIHDPGTLGNSVRHQFLQVIRLVFFRDRGYENSFLPWHSKGKGVNRRGKAVEKRVRNAGRHENNLNCRTALPVEGKAAEYAFPDGQIEIGAVEHNGRILGLQSQHTAQPIGVRVQFFQGIGCLARSDQTPVR